MKEFVFLVEEQFNNAKAVDFLKEKGVSSEILKKIKVGGIYKNGELLKNVNETLNAGDQIKIILPKDQPNAYLVPVKKPFEILYEDEFLLAVIKEKGITTHSSKHNQTLSLEQIICGYYKEPFTFRAVNRLDKDTSGIVLIAKDMLTASLLGEQMKKRKIIKKYLALCKGVPKSEHFVIEKPILRESENSIKRICHENGEYAKTECKLLKILDGDLSLIDILLITGKTHQIRVHLSEVGLPLYADSLYGEKVDGKSYFLEAYNLIFTHPFTKEKISLTTKNFA